MPQPDISQPVFKQCALCGGSSDLQESHIIPRFVFGWLRETSATGHFRSSENSNLRVQDGLKLRMLCQDCEQRFSSWEKKFAEECFVPLNEGSVHSVSYGPWMLKFATSVSWRVLRVCEARGDLAACPDHIMAKVNDTLQEWSQFLLDKKPHPGTHEQHMFMTGEVVATSNVNAPPNINRYLSRAIDWYVDYTQDSSVSYTKMGKFVLFGFVAMEHPRRWIGTKLHVQHGWIGEHDIELPSEVSDFFERGTRLAAESYSQMSERQHSRIRQSYEQMPDRADQSETVRAMHHDVLMFGKKAAFEITQPSAHSRTKKNDE